MKKIKKNKTNWMDKLINLDFINMVVYDYDRITDCYNNGCYDEGSMCRCSTIENFEVTEVYYTPILQTICEYLRKDGIELWDERIDLIKSILDKHGIEVADNYELITEHGYYGDEVGKIEFCGIRELAKDIKKEVY